MLKIIGIIGVFTGFFLGGKYLAFFQNEKVSVLADAVSLLTAAENRIRYSCPPLSDVLRALVDCGCGRLTPFVKVCAQAVACGIPFPDAWKKSLENERELKRLLGDQTVNMIKLGETLGVTDVEGQLACCEYYKAVFEAEIDRRRKESERYSKLFPPLGALMGVMAAIFMI